MDSNETKVTLRADPENGCEACWARLREVVPEWECQDEMEFSADRAAEILAALGECSHGAPAYAPCILRVVDEDVDVSDRDDIDEAPETPEERLPKVRGLLLSLAGRIGPQQAGGFFSEPPRQWGAAEVVAELAAIQRFLAEGVYR